MSPDCMNFEKDKDTMNPVTPKKRIFFRVVRTL